MGNTTTCNRSLAAACTAALLALAPSAAAADVTDTERADIAGAMEGATVRVGRGTGAVVDHGGLIVTCQHVLADSGTVTVSFPGLEGAPTRHATRLAVDEDKDLAIVAVQDAPGVSLGVAFSLGSF
ncbi:MAG: serine protease [Myxococcota bacterium]|nr:serine protease [Myxococcota bacterium]